MAKNQDGGGVAVGAKAAAKKGKAVAPAGAEVRVLSEDRVHVRHQSFGSEATHYRWTAAGFEVLRPAEVFAEGALHGEELAYDDSKGNVAFADAEGEVLRRVPCPDAARGAILASATHLCRLGEGSLWRLGAGGFAPVFTRAEHGPGPEAGSVETYGALVGSKAVVLMTSSEKEDRLDVVVADFTTGKTRAWPPRKGALSAFTTTREGLVVVLDGKLFTVPLDEGAWPKKSQATLPDAYALWSLPSGDLVVLPNHDAYLLLLPRRGQGFGPAEPIKLLQRRSYGGVRLLPAGEGAVILLGGCTHDERGKPVPLLPERVDLQAGKSACLPGWEAEMAKVAKLSRKKR